MLRPRIIPCLLIHKNGLVKTVGFSNAKYVGDPINAVKIFNEKKVDELIVLDIDATVNNQEPNYALIAHLAAESRMPICYGGGIKTVEQARKIIGLGIEKIAISSAALSHPSLITEIANVLGRQSVVVVLDVKQKNRNKYEIWTHNGKVNSRRLLKDVVSELMDLGCGEIVLNSIDQDGQMKGYDLNIIEQINDIIQIPLTVLGGAGSLQDMRKLIEKYGILGLAAGSLFVFKGVFRAVLINYPSLIEREELCSELISEFGITQ
jgi:imidazole glycerol-phosphate synthase subunit HisF